MKNILIELIIGYCLILISVSADTVIFKSGKEYKNVRTSVQREYVSVSHEDGTDETVLNMADAVFFSGKRPEETAETNLIFTPNFRMDRIFINGTNTAEAFAGGSLSWRW